MATSSIDYMVCLVFNFSHRIWKRHHPDNLHLDSDPVLLEQARTWNCYSTWKC